MRLENVTNGLPAFLHCSLIVTNPSPQLERIESIRVKVSSPWNVRHSLRPAAYPAPHRFQVPANGRTQMDFDIPLNLPRSAQAAETTAEMVVTGRRGRRYHFEMRLPALPVPAELMSSAAS